MPTALTVYRWELRKLLAQKRTYMGLATVALIPLAFVIALSVRHGASAISIRAKYVVSAVITAGDE